MNCAALQLQESRDANDLGASVARIDKRHKFF